MDSMFKVKQITMKVLSNPIVNAPMRGLLAAEWARRLIPDPILTRIPVNKTFEVPVEDGGSFRMVSDGFDSIANRVYWRGHIYFEPYTWPIFRRMILGARSFIDVGANVGFYTLLAAAMRPTLPIMAFEPVPNVASVLRQNIKASRFTNVTVQECALTDYDGTVTFNLPKQQTLPVGATIATDHFVPMVQLEVRAARLDTIVPSAESFPVDFLKIDTETTEPAVLRGMSRILRESRPTMICEVLRTHTSDGLYAVLDEFGYEYYWISRHGLIKQTRLQGDPEVIDQNFFFITPERKAELLAASGATTLEECFRLNG